MKEQELDELCRLAMITPSLEAMECLTILRDYWLENGEIPEDSATILERWQKSNAAVIGDRDVVEQTMRRQAERTVLAAAWTLAKERLLLRHNERNAKRI
jgi:hypothetical protein